MQEVIIGYQGEMSLKGLNRNQFESATIKILRYRVKDAGRFRIWCAQSTFYIEPEDAEADHLAVKVALLNHGIGGHRVEDRVGQAAVVIRRIVLCKENGRNPCGHHNGQHRLGHHRGHS